MNLCLPKDCWDRGAGLFRDDLGPTVKPSQAHTRDQHGVVCGLRDWRIAANPIAGTSRLTSSPTLKPYRAPDWLRACSSIPTPDTGLNQRGANTASSSTSNSRRQTSPCR